MSSSTFGISIYVISVCHNLSYIKFSDRDINGYRESYLINVRFKYAILKAGSLSSYGTKETFIITHPKVSVQMNNKGQTEKKSEICEMKKETSLQTPLGIIGTQKTNKT